MFTYPWGTDEDDLTRSFFGLVKYLPPDVLLLPFIDLIQSLYTDRGIRRPRGEDAEVLLWPSFEIPAEWRSQFNRPDMRPEKRRSKFYIVPDAIISFDGNTLIVEAEKSHSVEAEQLFQQYLIGRRQFASQNGSNANLFILLVNTDQMCPSSCHVSANDSATGITIYPTDSIPMYINKRLTMVGEASSIDEIIHSFIWVSWHHIGKLVEEVVTGYNKSEDRESKVILELLSGFKDLMDREGFHTVRVFRADDPDEVAVEDPTSVPVLRVLTDWESFLTNIYIAPEAIPVISTVRENSA